MSSYPYLELARRQFNEASFQYWLHQNLFTWQWWLLIAMTVAPWFVWWHWVDKSRLSEVITYGLFIGTVCTMLDLTGTNLVLWGYPYQLLWFIIPPIIPIDLCILPVEHMLLYQYFPRWKTYLLALIVLSAFNAFIAEPLFVRGDMYDLYHWKYIYSFPIYILKSLPIRWLMQKITQ